MPSKPLKPCNKPGCAKLTTGRYCEAHATQKTNDNRYYDRYARDQQATKFYHSTAWKKVRKLVIMESHGLCVQCYEEGKIVLGRVVDHIIPLKEDWSKALDINNLQYLCQACHNRKTRQGK
ncbi:HNH endonuclease [Rummeliibacillus stabekisii]|uniref:Putative HNH nuclease YajD n=1 Tax=Rummeliibacillus stabekisii TaxID=241244 RepID=A0A143HCL9_9BACL|nr:HNH endonuclease signature motif containing protein [Rummeliibacillus stabekisii]AMW98441.1 HNH endonuclease [Rummeliibacillus stabekisii]AMW99215.1 HNH endonuclease [Rummeliibacillus stabekisii]